MMTATPRFSSSLANGSMPATLELVVRVLTTPRAVPLMPATGQLSALLSRSWSECRAPQKVGIELLLPLTLFPESRHLQQDGQGLFKPVSGCDCETGRGARVSAPRTTSEPALSQNMTALRGASSSKYCSAASRSSTAHGRDTKLPRVSRNDTCASARALTWRHPCAAASVEREGGFGAVPASRALAVHVPEGLVEDVRDLTAGALHLRQMQALNVHVDILQSYTDQCLFSSAAQQDRTRRTPRPWR